MQTDTIEVWQLNTGDLVTLGSDTVWTLYGIEDIDDTFMLALRDDEGTIDVFEFMWDDSIEIVVSLDDPVEDEVDSPL